MLCSGMDFEERYKRQVQGMAFCGYKDSMVTVPAIRDALAIVATASNRTIDDDLRAEEPFLEALAYLERRTAETSLLRLIRRALDIPDPYSRAHQLSQLVHELRRRQGGKREIDGLPGNN